MGAKTVLITGVTGFIGRSVARCFAEEGWLVVGIGTKPPENSPLANLAAYYSFKLPDLLLREVLVSHKPDVCIHCAGRSSVVLSVTDPVQDYYTNSVLTFEVLNALRLYRPECRFVFLSSAAVYGNPVSLPIQEAVHLPSPLSPYGFHKLQSEQLCLEFSKVYGISTTAVRIFSAYGSGLRRQVLWDICHKAINGQVLSLQGTGRESRDFIHVSDVARALMVVVNVAPMLGEVYNLAAGREVTVADLAGLVLNCLGSSSSLVFDGSIPVGTPANWRADVSKISKLGFAPRVSLEDGVEAFVDWCKAELRNL
jgi:UDP-glucose 4-epimerase